MGWTVEEIGGDISSFLRRDVTAGTGPSLWWFRSARPTLILGSSQDVADVDQQACERLGVEVVRRRSGGGAVLATGDLLWVDIVVPVDHPLWVDDVSRSAVLVGERWQLALASLGIDDLHVHDGPMVNTRWSQQICFAGVGPGEVCDAAGRKTVGISQRRTRDGARLQCGLYRRWDAALHASLFAEETMVAGDLDRIATFDVDDGQLAAALFGALAAA